MTFEQLDLHPFMEQRARDLVAAFPSVQFTSGRRTRQQQAHAMACNVVTDRQFIGKTYLHAAVLQTAVDCHLHAKTVTEIQALLDAELARMPEEELAKVSDHLAGLAVDLLPMEDAQGMMTPTGQAVYTWIHNCQDTKQFLVREAGLVRWHWAISAPRRVDNV